MYSGIFMSKIFPGQYIGWFSHDSKDSMIYITGWYSYKLMSGFPGFGTALSMHALSDELCVSCRLTPTLMLAGAHHNMQTTRGVYIHALPDIHTPLLHTSCN